MHYSFSSGFFSGLTYHFENRHRILRVGCSGRYPLHRRPVCLHSTSPHRVAPLRRSTASFSLWRTCVHLLPVQGQWFPEIPLAEWRERPFHWAFAITGRNLLGQPTVYRANEKDIMTEIWLHIVCVPFILDYLRRFLDIVFILFFNLVLLNQTEWLMIPGCPGFNALLLLFVVVVNFCCCC